MSRGLPDRSRLAMPALAPRPENENAMGYLIGEKFLNFLEVGQMVSVHFSAHFSAAEK